MRPFSFLFRYRYGVLFFSLILLLVSMALAGTNPFDDEIFLGFFSVVLLSSIMTRSRQSPLFPALSFSGIFSVFLSLFSYTFPSPALDAWGALATFIFLVLVLFAIFSDIFQSPEVTGNIVLGAACLYLLLGVLFGYIFMIVDFVSPGSFAGTVKVVHGIPALFDHFFYFSFITLNTVGYGDIVPVSPLARYLAVTEATLGQLYLAILVARLVSLHLFHSQTSKKDRS